MSGTRIIVCTTCVAALALSAWSGGCARSAPGGSWGETAGAEEAGAPVGSAERLCCSSFAATCSRLGKWRGITRSYGAIPTSGLPRRTKDRPTTASEKASVINPMIEMGWIFDSSSTFFYLVQR